MMSITHNDSPRHSQLPGAAYLRLALLACAAAALIAAGCGEDEAQGPPPTHDFELEVSVTDEGENPVAKAPVMLDGQIVGYTDREGLFHGVINERENTEIRLGIGQMDTYLVPEDAERFEPLQLKKSLEGTMKPMPVTMHTTVRSVNTDYLVWIEVECDKYLGDKCAGLPVLVDGEERAQIGEDGTAHFVLTGVPETNVEVSITTPKYEPSADDDEDDSFVMKPESPTYKMELGLNPEVLLIKESFKDPVAAQKAEERRKKRARIRRIRQRRRAKSNSAKKKAKKKDKEVIDLW